MKEKFLNYLTIFGFAAGILLLIFTLFLNYQNFALKNSIDNITSRQSFEKAMNFVKEKKPTPPEAAIFYAEVAKDIFAENQVFTDENSLEKYFQEKLNNILEKEKLLPKVVIKKGNEKNEFWIGENPLSINIGSYEKYFLDNDFTYKVPPPPKYKNSEYNEALKVVKYASDNRTLGHNAIINFFGGVPGTETPSGIWQNLLWNVVLDDFQNLSNLKIKDIESKDNNKKYAYVQMILAESLADSFIKCWETKVIYQSKRPDMVDKTIKTAMPNPKFSSYVSGHSTISATAAVVLGRFFPSKLDSFVEDAENAKNSRLWAGIHFPFDNDEGYKLGEEIGKYIVEKVK